MRSYRARYIILLLATKYAVARKGWSTPPPAEEMIVARLVRWLDREGASCVATASTRMSTKQGGVLVRVEISVHMDQRHEQSDCCVEYGVIRE